LRNLIIVPYISKTVEVNLINLHSRYLLINYFVNRPTSHKTFINYNNYKDYRNYNKYKMETTTIAITKDVKNSIMEFGNKGETYSQIIEKLIKSAQQRQLHDLLMNSEGFIPIEEAIKEARKRWPK
jgi:predicted CopG family antitoxin